MKKAYQKPALYAETFQMVEHIAGEVCAYSLTNRMNAGNLNECAWVMDGLPIFLDGNGKCLEVTDSTEVPIACYDYGITTGDSTITVFS